ncbi:STAS domain-containing protein [Amycolatopsis rhabdoformis]|uniref:Anti-sigma factor antagonist n=1 Tax=Amycolatopsis rhabdoformis TaxID=1448059 RepID=A0ABZ1ICW6_9PSEU|nr:STAS domain-containing protein [Amycolatopsis rhabdoformis]WSE32092.1 STAS domain-containing protein [Amycolatopsis rhabdoformis]
MADPSSDPDGGSRLRVEAELTGTVTVVHVSGDVDLATTAQFEQSLLREVIAGPAALVIDLSAVDFLNSSGITSLVICHRQASTAGIPLAVASTRRQPLRILGMLGLTETLNAHDSVAGAVAALS